MSTLKKIGIWVLILGLVAFISSIAIAKDSDNPQEQCPISGEMPEEMFKSHTGIVKEISFFYDNEGNAVDGIKYILIETEDEHLVNFYTDERTYFLSKDEIKVGDSLTGFYDAALPVILIYPSQYHAVAIGVNLPEEQSIKVDRFDKDLLSYDKELKLNLGDNIEIITFEGEIVSSTDSLEDSRLLVIYSFTTKSLPPQTTPIKIVILPEAEYPQIDDEWDNSHMDSFYEDIPNNEIVVNDKIISAPSPYANSQRIIMVPLRAISQELGHKVAWDQAQKKVTLDNSIALKIGEDNYINSAGEGIQLGAAPEISQGNTYVPLKFFTQVIGMNNAYAFEAQIVVDNFEKME